jgi:CRP-like cAMP-binding protein
VVTREDTGLYSLTKADFKAAMAEHGTLKEQLLKTYFQRQ